VAAPERPLPPTLNAAVRPAAVEATAAAGAVASPTDPARTIGSMAADGARTWILTGSPENYAATAARGHTVIGCKERRRNQALQMEPGDRIVLYLTGVMRFAAVIRVTGELYEDRTPIWPGKPGKADAYPWRLPTEPDVVLDEDAWVPAESLKDDLEHIRKWPAEHWKLAFQGQLRAVSDADAALLMERMQAAAGVAA
jgi:predicted RNA-binding protein